MISASKGTLSLNNLKILRPKVTKNLSNFHKKFCESPPWAGWNLAKMRRVEHFFNKMLKKARPSYSSRVRKKHFLNDKIC